MLNYQLNTNFIQKDPTIFIDFKALPFVCASGVYDATINDLFLSSITVNGEVKQILKLNLICDIDGKKGQLSLTLDTDVNDTRFKNTQDLAIVCQQISPQGTLIFKEEVKQLKTPLSNGETTLTLFPDYEKKALKVAVRRSSKLNQKGVPYMNLVAFLFTNGATTYEALKNIKPTWLNEHINDFTAECEPLMSISQQLQQNPSYSFTPNINKNATANISTQAQTIYGNAFVTQNSSHKQTDEIPF